MANKTWPFDTPANYTYDAAKIEVADGLVKLKKTTWLNVYTNWHLNETAGAVAADASGNGRDGALISFEDIDWKPGKLNNCLEFDGANKYVDFGDIASFERNQPFSYECWLKTTETDLGFLMCRMGNAVPYPGMQTYIRYGKMEFHLIHNYSNNLISVKSATTVNDGLWHHFVATYDGSGQASGAKIYIDNIEQSVITKDTLSLSMITPADFHLGARSGGVKKWDGFIDEVLIYDKELTPTEVALRWNGGAGREEIPGDQYPMDKPTIQPVDSWQSFGLTQFTAFIETLGPGNEGTVRYQLSGDDGITWLYWNGAAWALAGADDYNDADTIELNIKAFLIDTDKVTFKAFLISDGTQKVELDKIEISAKKLTDTIHIIAGKVTLIKIETDKIQTQILDQKDEFKADISALPSVEQVQTIVESIQFLKDTQAGCWEIKENQMIFYRFDDDMQELMRFNLYNKLGKPTEKHVYKRCRQR